MSRQLRHLLFAAVFVTINVSVHAEPALPLPPEPSATRCEPSDSRWVSHVHALSHLCTGMAPSTVRGSDSGFV